MLVTIDTGGTKTLVASFGRDGKIIDSVKFPTPHDPTEYVKLVKETVRERYAEEKVDAIVLALPGIGIKNGIAKWCPNLGWKDFDAKKRLGSILPGVPFLLENDANLAGLSEARGLKTTPHSVLYVTISTGIGSAIITDGHINMGMRDSEAGRALVEYDGKIRQWEHFASGRVIVQVYKKFASDITSKRTWRQIADRISRGFLAVIPIIQPDVIIIGGSIGTYFDRYSEYLENEIRSHLPPYIPCPKIKRARHPEEAVIYGCYYYGTDYLSSQTTKKR